MAPCGIKFQGFAKRIRETKKGTQLEPGALKEKVSG
jgi:hypothetical protein